MNKKYELLIFDWDGTLMNSSAKIIKCFECAAKEVDLMRPDADEVKSYIGIGLDQAFRNLYPHVGEAVIDKLVYQYREYWLFHDHTAMPLFPGVLSGLQELNDAGYLLAIATGKSRAGLDRVFDELNLAHLFVYSRCADEVRTKPHPQMLLDIMEFTGFSAQQCVMVGDTSYDLEMAKHASMHGVGVTYGSHSESILKPLSTEKIAHTFPEVVSYFID